MRLPTLCTAGSLILAFATGHAVADSDKEKKQAEIRKVAATSLQEFYKSEPSLEADVAKAPGYALFTTYGLSFIIGAQGGKGLAFDNVSKKEYFMEMAQASAGIQAGLAESKVLIIFDSPKELYTFVNEGWVASGTAVAGAGAGESNASASGGATFGKSQCYTITSTGLQAGGALAGTKFWKDKALN